MTSAARTFPIAAPYTREQFGALGLVVGALLGLGLSEGTSGAIWPDVIDAFGVSKGQFGLAGGIGFTIAFPILIFGGRITTRFDKRALLALSAAMLASAAAGFTVGSGMLLLAVLMTVRGAGMCLVDLAANALAMEIETDTQRHVMSQLHAGFSGGAVIGAGIAWVVFRLGAGYEYIVLALAGLLAIYVVVSLRERMTRAMARRRTEVSGGSLHALRLFRRADVRVLAALCAVAFGGEVLIAQWIGIYLRDERGHSASIGVRAVVLFGGAMFAGRLLNSPVAGRLGPRTALLGQGMMLALGGGMIVAGGPVAISLAGCAVAGIGIAGIGPTALSLTGFALPESPGAASGAALIGGYIGVMAIPYGAGAVASLVSVRAVLSGEVVFGGIVVAAALMLGRWIALDRQRGAVMG